MMKKLLLIFFAFWACSPVQAQTIDQLGVGAPLVGTERIPMFQNNNPAVVTTPNAIIALFLGAGHTWPGTQTFGPVIGTVTTQGGSAYTLTPSDCGTEVGFTNASTITVTIPATLPFGCNIAILQVGVGKVLVTGVAVSAATLRSAHGYTSTFAQWSVIGINIWANVGGAAAVAVLTGDGA